MMMNSELNNVVLDEVNSIYTNDPESPYYTNSCLPSSSEQGDFLLLTNAGDKLCRYCSGGVVVHYYTPDVPNKSSFYAFMNTILRSKIPYFTLSRIVSYCSNCNETFEDGSMDKCPHCGNAIDKITRVVGYARPISNWNVGKKAEWNRRRFISFSE